MGGWKKNCRTIQKIKTKIGAGRGGGAPSKVSIDLFKKKTSIASLTEKIFFLEDSGFLYTE